MGCFDFFYEDIDVAALMTEYDCTELEAKILLMREDKQSYGMIQQYLGNPSKKFIRQILLKYKPELIDIECK